MWHACIYYQYNTSRNYGNYNIIGTSLRIELNFGQHLRKFEYDHAKKWQYKYNCISKFEEYPIITVGSSKVFWRHETGGFWCPSRAWPSGKAIWGVDVAGSTSSTTMHRRRKLGEWIGEKMMGADYKTVKLAKDGCFIVGKVNDLKLAYADLKFLDRAKDT